MVLPLGRSIWVWYE